MCCTGAVVAGVVVTLVILLLLVVVGSVGVIAFLTYRRKAARLNGTGAFNQNISVLDNPISKSTLQESVHHLITFVCYLSGK